MAAEVGELSPGEGFQGIIDMTKHGLINNRDRFSSPKDVQDASQRILRGLFPSWLLPAFRVMFAKPMPQVSGRMIALVTAVTCQWLMGPMEITNANTTRATLGTETGGLGIKVSRCRFLEESGCVSVCLNCCKIPTQRFFSEDMGVPMTMTPDYDDFSCQFDFLQTPLDPEMDEAYNVPCFSQCSTQRREPYLRGEDRASGNNVCADSVSRKL
eukprot:CAMPEP_0114502720 /NCGR_PEP_ID=MMETSP0109-20121206/9254_1 /TAXON_ID=29199 /ORGANISM="Chlorarachnion reptans, Strain CCCM449" /LENGTH=212 /DNA_ID=CAMNT_0001680679 /DNA_START=333 /DNA_END=971 /DNA_ORIENTATION=-